MSRVTPSEEAIFEIARQIESLELQADYIDQACAGDSALKCRVAGLLELHQTHESFLESPAIAPTVGQPVKEMPGDVIGPYKLLQKIGEGGFGVVYMAEQHRPVRRKVALKVIKPGMDTKEVIARFEAERQALAMMDHPNIAKVLDGGETENGRPYFVMELVKGVPLTEFCDRNKLSTHDRLELFVTICRAVQHAHQKGVIHRDLKPSNVMVTLNDNRPVPMVIDFGVSKAVSQQLTEKTLFTAYGQMIGTPVYMSPEQAQMSGLDIDTRSDIYSLGVLLYELLTGTTPLEASRFRGTAYAEMQRMIMEEESPKPSVRLSTMGNELTSVAEHRGTDASRLGYFLRGDLDWIVMKSIEKERGRRYETASSFAADVERFLTNEAVEARPPSIGYKLQKFASRNRGPVIAGTLIAATLLLGVIGTTVGMLRAKQAARNSSEMAEVAEHQRSKAQEEQTRAQLAEKEQRNLAEKLETQNYIQLINLAQVAVKKGRPADALALLDDCPEALRGWEWDYMKRLVCSDRLASLHVDNLPGSVLAGTWSPTDPNLAVVLTHDGSLTAIERIDGDKFSKRLLRKTNAKIVEKFVVQNPHYSIWFTPTGDEIAVPVGVDGYELVDLGTGDVTGKIDGRDDFLTLAFHPVLGKKLVATACVDGTIRLWDAGGKQLDRQEMRHERSWVTDIEFSQDGKLIASGDYEGDAYIWSAETGECIQTIHAHIPPINVLAWSRDGKQLVTASYDHQVILWDVLTGAKMQVFRGHTDSIFGVAFCGKDRIASTAYDGTARIWQIGTEHEVLTIDQITTNFGNLVFNSDGKRLLATTNSDSVTIWDANPGATETLPQRTIDQVGRVFDIQFLPDGHHIIAAGEKGVQVFDTRTGKEEPFETPITQRASGATALPNGQQFVATLPPNREGQALVGPIIFDLKSGAVLQRPKYSGNDYMGISVAVSRDGRWLANGGSRHACLWDLDVPLDEQESRVLGEASEYVYDMRFSPCGRYLGIRLADELHLWDAHRLGDSQESRSLTFERGSEFEFSPDGEWMAMARTDGNLTIATTGRDSDSPRKEWKASEADIIDLAYHPNGRFLASAGSDKTIRIWSVQTGELAQVFVGEGKIFCLAFSPDGRDLVSGSHSKRIKVWDTSYLND